MKRIAVLLMLLVATEVSAAPPTVTISGKLVNRICSVEDSFQLQAQTEKRCTLWIESSFSCPCASCDSGSTTCKEVHTVYCPRKAADRKFFNSAYDVCSDGGAMQINHPTATYTIVGYLRTVEQQMDGFGQIQGQQFSY